MQSPEEIVDFWRSAGPLQWFAKSPAFDADVRDRFRVEHGAAVQGDLDTWSQTPIGALALVLLLNQYPRNAFRGTARMFASDVAAHRIAALAIDAGFDRLVDPAMKRFFCLPLMHSENRADQDRCVAYARDLDQRTLEEAQYHRGLIERFGRFPHRNAALGRTSTTEEIEFLDQRARSRAAT